MTAVDDQWPLRIADPRMRAMPMRQSDLVSNVNRDVLIRRPSYYCADGELFADASVFKKHFGDVILRSAYAEKEMSFFGRPVASGLLWLADLEGMISNREWLNQYAILAGLFFALQDMEDFVFVSASGVFPSLSSTSRGWEIWFNKQIDDIKRKRFHVWPLFLNENHWALGIYDQKTNWFRYYDSNVHRDKVETDAKTYAKLLHACYRTNSVTKEAQFDVKGFEAVQQTNEYACGLHVCENARFFLREAVDERSLEWDWRQSTLYPQKDGSTPKQQEERMIATWTEFCRRELGTTGRIRYPSRPLVSYRYANVALPSLFDVPNCLSKERSLTRSQIEAALSAIPTPLDPSYEGREQPDLGLSPPESQIVPSLDETEPEGKTSRPPPRPVGPPWPLQIPDPVLRAMPARQGKELDKVVERHVLIRRPAYYLATGGSAGDRRRFLEHFPGFSFRPAYEDKLDSFFGMSVVKNLLCLADLEGLIRNQEWLDQDAIVAALVFVLQDMEELVFISPELAFPSESSEKVGIQESINRVAEAIKGKRFHIWPTHKGGNHWALGIYDQQTNRFRHYDSCATVDRIRTSAHAHANLIHTLYKKAGITEKDAFRVESMNTVQQTSSYSCGLHVCENARFFLREATEESSVAWDWAKSPLYAQDRRTTRRMKEQAMLDAWADFCRRELGTTRRIRYPSQPLVSLAYAAKMRPPAYNFPNYVSKKQNLTTESIEAILSTIPEPLDDSYEGDEKPGLKLTPPSHPIMKVDPISTRHTVNLEPEDPPGGNVTEASKLPGGPAGASSSYAHPLSPIGHLSPTHEEGWPGWDEFRRREMEEDEDVVQEQDAERDARPQHPRKRGRERQQYETQKRELDRKERELDKKKRELDKETQELHKERQELEDKERLLQRTQSQDNREKRLQALKEEKQALKKQLKANKTEQKRVQDGMHTQKSQTSKKDEPSAKKRSGGSPMRGRESKRRRASLTAPKV